MSVHSISLNPMTSEGRETLLDIVGAINTARDLASIIGMASASLPRGRREAIGTASILLEDALHDIAGRLEALNGASDAA